MVDKNDPFEAPDFQDFLLELDTDDPGPYLRNLEEHLKSRVLGQDRAIRHVVRALSISEAKMLQPGEPAGLLLFAGPPGVGKTELAYQAALAWLGIDIAADIDGLPYEPLTKIDCTQLTEQISITELIGSKKGYVGYTDEVPFHQQKLDEPHYNQLRKNYNPEFSKIQDEFLRRVKIAGNDDQTKKQVSAWYQREYKKFQAQIESHKPFKGVILLDEVEKAHEVIHNLILSIANGKPLKLSDGSRTNFENKLIIMTSNIGWQKIQQLLQEARGGGNIGIVDREQAGREMSVEETMMLDQKIYSTVFREIEKFFSAAFMSRIRRKIIVFRPLSRELLRRIVYQKLSDIQMLFAGLPVSGKKAAGVNLSLRFSAEFQEFILAKSTDSQYGVRDLEQVIEKYVEEKVANLLNSGNAQAGDSIVFDIRTANDIEAMSTKEVVCFKE